MGGTSASDGDLFTVVGVNAFGTAGVAVSLLDFFLLQGRTLFMLHSLGVATLALGLAIELSARRALGRQFTVRIKTAAEQKLIHSGPYKYIRHPLYLGIILAYFSGPIAWQSAYGALIILPIVPLLLRRISIEEKAMALKFGGEYEGYAKRTKKLFPLIYRSPCEYRF